MDVFLSVLDGNIPKGNTVVIGSIIDWVWTNVTAVVGAVLSSSMDVFMGFLEAYGFWAFIAASAIKGLGIFVFGPAEAVTPAYVLYVADTPYEAALVAVVGAGTITASNFVLYLAARFAGDRFSVGDDDSTSWRIITWLTEEHARISMVVLRIIPVVSVIVAIPAGLARMKVRTFLIYSFIGFLIVEGALAFGAFYGVEGNLGAILSNIIGSIGSVLG